MTSIELRGVSFGYGGSNVIDDLSLTVAASSVTALVGPSGSGKSTLLYLAGLLLSPARGAVVIDGVDWARRSDAERSRFRGERIGFVFQDAALDTTRTVLDNVVEGAVYAGRPRRSVVEAVHQLAARLDVSVPLDRRANGLSGGQAHRVGICRALLRAPTFVLADEPTGNLDVENRELVFGVLEERARAGATVVIATHDRELAVRCHDIVAIAGPT